MPYKLPPSPPLPSLRVQKSPPFSFTGIDFAGPLFVKLTETASVSKVWICLYTCGIIRAVHLDIVSDLSTISFLNSFRRFVARCGLPRTIVTDNGKTFKSAATVLNKVLNTRDVQQHLSHTRVNWTFNLERAPWWGGFFERMIKSVKRCLKKVLGNSSLSHDELLTILIEVEGVLNSRPLSFISADDNCEPLTPSHLLRGHSLLALPPFIADDNDVEFLQTQSFNLIKRWKHLDLLLNHFWKRWYGEHLVELREHHRYGIMNKQCPKFTLPAIGDVVLVYDQDRPRHQWRMAIIEELIDSSDSRVRGATCIVRTVAKNGKISRLRRSVCHLYPLEVKETENYDTIDESNDQEQQPIIERRAKRRAAVTALDGIISCNLEDD
jgi:hypothetical protein